MIKRWCNAAAVGVKRRRRLVAVLALVLMAGMLFWGRLLMMQDVPRTAIADPEAQHAASAEGDAEEGESDGVLRRLGQVLGLEGE